MIRVLSFLGRFTVTALMLVVAGVIGWQMWIYYMEEPWTRDGKVRADVVAVAPDVSGMVSDVLVRDNQDVNRGDILFRIDPDRFQLALRQADAALAGRKATLDQTISTGIVSSAKTWSRSRSLNRRSPPSSRPMPAIRPHSPTATSPA
jgi:multidrug resistance efflux pump